MKTVILFANWGLGKLVLNKLIKQGNVNISAIVTQFNSDIDYDPYYNIVYEEGKKNDLKIFSHWNEVPDDIINNSDFGLSVSFHQIFKREILEKFKIINFHPSALPKYRGPSPILWQIIDGCKEIGGTLHNVDEGIDTGEILHQGTFKIDYNLEYNVFVDNMNDYFSSWVVGKFTEAPTVQKKVTSKGEYYHRIDLKFPLRNQKLDIINEVLNRKKITIFSGNRAEFGILFPLLVSLSEYYFVDLILSGGHTQKPWETKNEVYKLVSTQDLQINILEIDQSNVKNHYRDSMLINYSWCFDYFIKNKSDNFIFSSICMQISYL